MGKECGAWVSRRLWGGGNTSPLKTTAWEASKTETSKFKVPSFCLILDLEIIILLTLEINYLSVLLY